MRTCSPITGAVPNSSRVGGGAEGHDLGARPELGLREAPTIGDRPVANLEEVFVYAGDRRGQVGVADHERGRAANGSRRGGDVRNFGADRRQGRPRTTTLPYL